MLMKWTVILALSSSLCPTWAFAAEQSAEQSAVQSSKSKVVVEAARASVLNSSHWQKAVLIPPTSIENIGGIEGLKERFLATASQHGITPEFSPAIAAEIAAFSAEGISFDGLEDLTHIPFVTIDNDHSKDLDQALAFEKTGRGHNPRGYRLHYAIADAAYFVRPGSAIDERARARIFTTYSPFIDVPVLPRALSEDLCTLAPASKRRAIVVSIDLDSKGKVQLTNKKEIYTIRHAVIQSRAQLSYRGVQEFYDHPEVSSLQGKDYTPSLELLRHVGKLLVKQSKKRQVIPFPEGEMRLIEEKDKFFAAIYQRYQVEYWNEQVSVIANHIIAKFIASNGKNSIHRYHKSPSMKRMSFLHLQLRHLGRKWADNQSLSRYMDSLLEDSDSSLNQVAQSLVCRTNYKAEYSAVVSGHCGLKLGEYDHFTAPMRRYTDIVVHRIVLAILAEKSGETPASWLPVDAASNSIGALTEVAELANEAMDRENAISRKNDEFVAGLILAPYVGKNIAGEVVFLNAKGLNVKLKNYPITLWLPKDRLGELGAYEPAYDGVTARIEPAGVVRLGDRMDVTISEINAAGQVIAVPSFVAQNDGNP